MGAYKLGTSEKAQTADALRAATEAQGASAGIEAQSPAEIAGASVAPESAPASYEKRRPREDGDCILDWDL